MQLNPAEISELIKNKIQGFDEKTETSTQGSVISVTDGICKIHGLSEAMQGEMLEFPGETFGLALNLERDSVGAVILGDYEHISEGDTVKCTGRILEVPVGPELMGRVVNSLGQPLDGKGEVKSATTAPIASLETSIRNWSRNFKASAFASFLALSIILFASCSALSLASSIIEFAFFSASLIFCLTFSLNKSISSLTLFSVSNN